MHTGRMSHAYAGREKRKVHSEKCRGWEGISYEILEQKGTSARLTFVPFDGVHNASHCRIIPDRKTKSLVIDYPAEISSIHISNGPKVRISSNCRLRRIVPSAMQPQHARLAMFCVSLQLLHLKLFSSAIFQT